MTKRNARRRLAPRHLGTSRCARWIPLAIALVGALLGAACSSAWSSPAGHHPAIEEPAVATAPASAPATTSSAGADPEAEPPTAQPTARPPTSSPASAPGAPPSVIASLRSEDVTQRASGSAPAEVAGLPLLTDVALETATPALDERDPLTVVLDPGHGGEEFGAVEAGLIERDLNLDIALRVEVLLEAEGIRVVMTRRGEGRSVLFPSVGQLRGALATAVDLQARVDLANQEQGDVFVSIHANAFTPDLRGVEVWWDSARRFGGANSLLAEALLTHVLAEVRAYGYPALNRGLLEDGCWRMVNGHCETLSVLGPPHEVTRADVLARGQDPEALGFGPDDDAVVTRATQMPGALIEALFISNPDDARVLRREEGRQAIARGIAQGILAFLAEYRPDR